MKILIYSSVFYPAIGGIENHTRMLAGEFVRAGHQVKVVTEQAQGDAPPAHAIEIASLKGCDVAPVDLTDPAQALRLKGYIWPEHGVRFERMDAAIKAAQAKAPDLVQMNAADFVEAELAHPQEAGTTRVLMHSIVWQYVPKDQQARVTAAMEAAGAKATAERPLAWIALEANRDTHRHEMVVRYWPGGEQGQLLGEAHPHGAWIKWMG